MSESLAIDFAIRSSFICFFSETVYGNPSVFVKKIKNLREEDLENEAARMAEKYIIKHADDEDIFINTIAGFFGYTNIQD